MRLRGIAKVVGIASFCLLVCYALWAKAEGQAGAPAVAPTERPRKERFQGKVVLLADALRQRDVKAYAEDLKDQVALETPQGELLPILPDWRGRAFHQDARLRNRRVELIGFRRPGLPFLQVLTIYTFDAQGQRQYTDYWCDICAIPMYEIKPCDCCQQDIRLRFQPQELPQDLDDAASR